MTPVALGLGLRPGTTAERIRAAVDRALRGEALGCLATLDRRAAEPGLVAVAADLAVPVLAFDATTLAAVVVARPSPRVRAAVGTPSVAEASAVLAAGGPLLRPREVIDGIVVAVARISPTAHRTGSGARSADAGTAGSCTWDR